MSIKSRLNSIFNINQPLVITLDSERMVDVGSIDLSNINRPVIFRTTKRDIVEDIYNQEAPSIDKKTTDDTGKSYRVITVTQWRSYMEQATLPTQYYPNWSGIIDLYDNMEEDSHVSGVISTLTERVRSKSYYITNQDGDRDEETTKIFKSKWFFDFLNLAIRAQLRGFNLVQLGDFNEELQRFDWVKEINQKHQRHDLGGVVRQEYDQRISQSWEDEPFKTWTIPIYFDKLGRLNKAARWYIYKTEVARFWAEYNETYGVPGIIGKTKLTESSRRKNFVKYLQSFASTRFGLFDVDDVVETIDIKGSTSAQIYENFIRLADEQISKGLLSSTMVLDSGSSRSQSETHEENTSLIVKSLSVWIGFIINDELLCRMKQIGFNIPEGSTFVWDSSEKLTSKDKADIIKTLSDSGYSVNAEEVTEATGFTVEAKEIETPQPPQPSNINLLETIENRYNIKKQ